MTGGAAASRAKAPSAMLRDGQEKAYPSWQLYVSPYRRTNLTAWKRVDRRGSEGKSVQSPPRLRVWLPRIIRFGFTLRLPHGVPQVGGFRPENTAFFRVSAAYDNRKACRGI